MAILKHRCTKGLSDVNSLPTINIHLLNHELHELNEFITTTDCTDIFLNHGFSDLKVQSVALRSHELNELLLQSSIKSVKSVSSV